MTHPFPMHQSSRSAGSKTAGREEQATLGFSCARRTGFTRVAVLFANSELIGRGDPSDARIKNMQKAQNSPP